MTLNVSPSATARLRGRFQRSEAKLREPASSPSAAFPPVSLPPPPVPRLRHLRPLGQPTRPEPCWGPNDGLMTIPSVLLLTVKDWLPSVSLSFSTTLPPDVMLSRLLL